MGFQTAGAIAATSDCEVMHTWLFVFPDSDFASLRTAWGGAIFLGITISSLFAVLIIFAKKTRYPG